MGLDLGRHWPYFLSLFTHWSLLLQQDFKENIFEPMHFLYVLAHFPSHAEAAVTEYNEWLL
jgi:hypothetical protein